MRHKWTAGFLASAVMLLLLLPPAVSAQSTSARKNPSTRAMLRQLSKRVTQIESQNRELARENRELRAAVSRAQGQISQLEAQARTAGRTVPELQAEMPKVRERVARTESQIEAVKSERSSPGTTVGFRQGWSEVPFDLPGGVFYGGFIRHILLTQHDGIPGGDLSGELQAGTVFGEGKSVTVTTALLGKQTVDLSEDLISIQPSAQYHLRLLEPFEPYFLAGPSIFVSIPQSPGLVAGQVPLPNEIRQFRIRPGVTSAEFYAGAVFGAGVRYHLTSLHIPAIQSILNKVSVGAEWRFNYMDDGEEFQQYTSSISLGF